MHFFGLLMNPTWGMFFCGLLAVVLVVVVVGAVVMVVTVVGPPEIKYKERLNDLS